MTFEEFAAVYALIVESLNEVTDENLVTLIDTIANDERAHPAAILALEHEQVVRDFRRELVEL
jgi:hypothetical protein